MLSQQILVSLRKLSAGPAPAKPSWFVCCFPLDIFIVIFLVIEASSVLYKAARKLFEANKKLSLPSQKPRCRWNATGKL